MYSVQIKGKTFFQLVRIFIISFHWHSPSIKDTYRTLAGHELAVRDHTGGKGALLAATGIPANFTNSSIQMFGINCQINPHTTPVLKTNVGVKYGKCWRTVYKVQECDCILHFSGGLTRTPCIWDPNLDQYDHLYTALILRKDPIVYG